MPDCWNLYARFHSNRSCPEHFCSFIDFMWITIATITPYIPFLINLRGQTRTPYWTIAWRHIICKFLRNL